MPHVRLSACWHSCRFARGCNTARHRSTGRFSIEKINGLEIARAEKWDQQIAHGGDVFCFEHQAIGRRGNDVHPVHRLSGQVIGLLIVRNTSFRNLVRREIFSALTLRTGHSISIDDHRLPLLVRCGPIQHSLEFGNRPNPPANVAGLGPDAKASGGGHQCGVASGCPAGARRRRPVVPRIVTLPENCCRLLIHAGVRGKRFAFTRRLRTGFGNAQYQTTAEECRKQSDKHGRPQLGESGTRDANFHFAYTSDIGVSSWTGLPEPDLETRASADPAHSGHFASASDRTLSQ